MPNHNYYVYILANKNNTVLYTGITRDLPRRLAEHRQGTGSKFTGKYNIHKLVYFEYFSSVETAIAREKQIKSGSRSKKLELVETMNKEWNDLSLKVEQS
jgi:putative endonuclease